MNIASMLNLSTGPSPPESIPKDVTPPLPPRAGFTTPSSLPTPSPECQPAKQASSFKDNRVRTPWDAGGYSLPRDGAPQYQRSSFPFRPAVEPMETPAYSAPTPGGHSRHSSIALVESPMTMAAPSVPAPFSNPRQARRMHSTSDVQQDVWMRRSSYCEPRPQPEARRASLWTEHGVSLPVGLGSSPRHQVSDSRSSFSSLCSSTFSGGHSRFSSMSTVGSHQVSSVAAEMPLLESKLEQLPSLTSTPEYAEHREPSPRLPPLPQYNAMPPRAPSLPRGSPSDCVLEARAIKRKRSRLSIDQSHSSLRSSVLHPLERIHKRTISAPNPPQISSSPFARTSSYLPPITPESLEPVLPPPHLTMPRGPRSVSRGRRASRADISPIGIPASRSVGPIDRTVANADRSPAPPIQALSAPIASSSDFQSRFLHTCARFGLSANNPLRGGDICMHVDNCNTGSVPRKVISHLFGRNKVCTRRIPERAWVCMCRKHYQRIRYRKGAEFSMTQIDLVYEQIARMIFWSQGLEKNGGPNVEGIYIRSWTFSIRKRELRRLVESNGQDPLPRWIIQSLGEGKTHEDILNVVERLHHDIQQGVLRDVPPVEFLPDVVDAYTQRAAHSPNTIKREGSDDLEMHDVTQSSELLGDDEGSPFSKDTSPLEPVEEEHIDYRSSGEGSLSPSASAISEDTQRPPTSIGNHQRQHSGSQDYAPRSQMDYAQPDDGHNSHPEYDSQNPQLPPMNELDVNFEIQESAMTTGDLWEPPYNAFSPQGASSSISSDLVLINSQAPDLRSSPASLHGAPAIPLVNHSQVDIVQFDGYPHRYQSNHGFLYVSPPVQPQTTLLSRYGAAAFRYSEDPSASYLSPSTHLETPQTTDPSVSAFGRSWQGHIEAAMGPYHTRRTYTDNLSDIPSTTFSEAEGPLQCPQHLNQDLPVDSGDSDESFTVVEGDCTNVDNGLLHKL